MTGRKIDSSSDSKPWCILRTSGPQTLKLAEYLQRAGFDAWTPIKRFRRYRKLMDGGRAPSGEATAPILPTFVFVRAAHLPALADMRVDPTSQHPGFSIFQVAGKIPRLKNAQIAGMRAAQEAADAEFAAVIDAEVREERRAERAAMMKTERAKRKALRQVEREFPEGTGVQVMDMPAMAGMVGIVEASAGRSALVSFGGSLVMEIEAWQLTPYDVIAEPLHGIAA